MFGTFRLLLAMAVVLSHMGVLVWGIHAGIVGVVCFFMVSGYAMSGLIGSTFPNLGREVPAFYLDRILRLAPQYYFYLAVGSFTVLFLGWRVTAGQSGQLDFMNAAANVLVLPMTFWMYDKSIGTLLIILPAWSLGLEICFYLLLPWILRRRIVLLLAALIGAVVWTASTQGIINPDWYAYRLLPGTLVFFLVGVALQRRDWLLFFSLAGFFALNAVALWLGGKLWLEFNAHLLVGAAVGCVVLPVLAMLPRNAWDEELGAASYGCYLAHWIFVTGLQGHFGQPWAVSLAIAGSVVSGWLTYRLLEAPTVRYRRHRRLALKSSSLPAVASQQVTGRSAA